MAGAGGSRAMRFRAGRPHLGLLHATGLKRTARHRWGQARCVAERHRAGTRGLGRTARAVVIQQRARHPAGRLGELGKVAVDDIHGMELPYLHCDLRFSSFFL